MTWFLFLILVFIVCFLKYLQSRPADNSDIHPQNQLTAKQMTATAPPPYIGKLLEEEARIAAERRKWWAEYLQRENEYQKKMRFGRSE